MLPWCRSTCPLSRQTLLLVPVWPGRSRTGYHFPSDAGTAGRAGEWSHGHGARAGGAQHAQHSVVRGLREVADWPHCGAHPVKLDQDYQD